VTERTDEKKTRLLAALEQGQAQLHLDARRPGVMVPEQFRTEAHLVLNVSYRFDPPDLTVNDWGVRQTLSFNRKRFSVGLPWSSIYAVASLVTNELFMFRDDLPEEFAEAISEPITEADLKVPAAVISTAPAPAPALAEQQRPRAVLREVVLEPRSDADDGPSEPPTEPTPPKRGHLRVVK
jgi:stringent starvation protein B